MRENKRYEPDEVILPTAEEMEKARKLDRKSFVRMCERYLFMTYEEMELLVKSKKIPSVEMMIVSAIMHSIKDGDPKYLSFFLDRIVGQVAKKIIVETEVDPIPKAIPVPMTDEERLEMLELMKKRITEGMSGG